MKNDNIVLTGIAGRDAGVILIIDSIIAEIGLMRPGQVLRRLLNSDVS